MVNRAVHLAVPLEILAGGREDQHAPSVVDVYAEAEVVDLVIVGLRDAEEFIQTIPVWMNSVGQQNLQLTRLDGESGHRLAISLRRRDRICALFVHNDGLRRFTCTPHIILQLGLDF